MPADSPLPKEPAANPRKLSGFPDT